VDSVGNVNATVTALQSELGSSYDVVSSAQQSTNIQAQLNAIEGNANLASYIALFSAAAVLALVMALVTRERTSEIGLLKAVGFKNSRIVAQFLTEGLALAMFGFVAAIALTLVLGPTIDSLVLGGGGGFAGGAGGFGGRLATFGGFGVRGGGLFSDPSLIVIALVVTVILGIVGSLYPVLRAMSLKPAEALRRVE
jgi:putative ABC transport system permease protein